jgi:hypothetical protein
VAFGLENVFLYREKHPAYRHIDSISNAVNHGVFYPAGAEADSPPGGADCIHKNPPNPS